ncbi:tetratricopeptide repeat protein [Dyella sp. 2RAB6]|uniref:tetratricopeptide repeat protein n=1 Tax=Dyella sp. 2RAB6 TaxID=3232992 RepID=UPI003F8DBD0B
MPTASKATSRSGDPREMLETACDLYETGERHRSMQLFKRAAIAGVIEAQVNLANVYDAGDGVRRNFETARYWYKRAISQGSPEAAYNLAVSYLNRDNFRWARHWLLVAEQLGDEDARELLEGLV